MYTGHRAEHSFRFPQKLAKDVKGKKITSYAKQLALTMFSSPTRDLSEHIRFIFVNGLFGCVIKRE